MNCERIEMRFGPFNGAVVEIPQGVDWPQTVELVAEDKRQGVIVGYRYDLKFRMLDVDDPQPEFVWLDPSPAVDDDWSDL